MMDLPVLPIDVWPEGWRRNYYGERSRFGSTYSNTLEILERELKHLHAKDVALLIDADPSQFKLNGAMRANAKSNTPGCILRFRTPTHGTLTYPCNKFDRWQDNLRAIALGLEALRKVERYGIAERGQQYAGYAALGAGIALGEANMTVEEAAKFVTKSAGAVWYEGMDFDIKNTLGLFTLAAKRLHPDAGGDTATFQKLIKAKEILEREL